MELTVPERISTQFEQRGRSGDLLRWLYVGRLTLVAGILVAALFDWSNARSVETLIVTVMFVLTAGVTAWSFWYTHLTRHEPSENFLYSQVVLDALVVTGIVHLTGGAESGFASVYILVISAGALLLPLPGGLLIGGLVSMLYFADLAWGFQETFTIYVALRIALFTLVALITGVLGDRLRRAGQALGAVASELQQLRLDTGDILANLSTGVITVDGNGYLAYANPAAESLLGTGLQPMLGRPVLDEVDRVAPGLGSLLQEAIHRRTAVARGRVETTSPTGAARLGVSIAVLERGPGEMPSATALFQDITDLERLGELNVRAERLEAVATLSASLAHEIKNPLASIRSAVEQLSRGRLSPSDRGVLERLVLNESDRLSRLLSEFLDYSGLAMSAGEELDVHALVRGCLLLAKQHPALSGVEVVGNVGVASVHMIGDADLLHRALFNLVLNGGQAAGPGGRVVVTLENERNRMRPRGTAVEHPIRLSVGDSGPGVEASERSRIFEPFFTTKGGGSGLGLAVVHRAVEAHSGVIFVEESPDGGAEFVIFLPGIPAAPIAQTSGVGA
ncbi:MAG: ATP-binding protein [Gemmatimonadetes bacterium]|nr:ATP-binding protein [Gemmatimonadota bacterium]MDA1103780.1 ATP-binding protein [Gemmatimonadota bacterium]